MNGWIDRFQRVLDVSIRLYFRWECDLSSVYGIALPRAGPLWKTLLSKQVDPTFGEWMVLMLVLMPYLSSQALDIFSVYNKNLDCPYTESGGWKGLPHEGFLPMGETVVFLLMGDRVERRLEVVRLFREEHWFHMYHVVDLEGTGNGEPFLSGQLRISEDFLYRSSLEGEYKPDYNMGFPAKRTSTTLNWRGAVSPYYVYEELEEINNWITGHRIILLNWGLSHFLKTDYRTLFYGPPGTGRTLYATLIGKKDEMDVYCIDLSMTASKHIGETKKDLVNVFDQAENQNWIFFFDEADALFGKRTSTNTSNDCHSNQETAYLLQRIEDFPRTVVLVTNLKSNTDEAFSRRLQSIIYLSMPDQDLREELWRRVSPSSQLSAGTDKMICMAATHELSGGSTSNVIRRCALRLLKQDTPRLDPDILLMAIRRELNKEDRW